MDSQVTDAFYTGGVLKPLNDGRSMRPSRSGASSNAPNTPSLAGNPPRAAPHGHRTDAILLIRTSPDSRRVAWLDL